MSDAFDILVGAALKEGSVDDAIQELKNKLAQESNKVKVDLGIKGVDGKDKSSGTKSEVSAAKELKSTYSSIGQLLNQNEKRQLQIKNITTSVAETNQKVLRYQQEYNEKTGKLTDPAKASLMVKRTDELKQKYDSMLANLRERAKLEERLIKIKGQGKVKEEEVLQTQIKSSKIAYDELKADADKLKLSKGITTQTTEEIALSREKLRIEQQMAQLSARSQDKANNQLVNQLYKESLSSLKQIDALSKKIAQAEATKSKEYEKQLRLQRQSLQAKVDENNKILEQVASENSKLNISAQQDALAKRQLTNEKNIAVYKQQALSTLKATKGVFSGFVNELKIAVTRSIEWGIAMGALYGSVRKLKDGVQFLIDVDTSLTEIAMVTQQSREEVQGLTQDYLDLAKALKISTKEIFDSAVSLYRQGLSADEVNSRLQTLSQTSKVTGESITTVTDYVTAGVNTLGVEANRFNDILIKTASIAGTTYGELGEAISKNAASFNNANVNLEKITSYMATILETTREAPQSVGTFGKTLVGRFQRINKATGELNEDLNAVQKAMESVGVDFLDAAGQIRPVSDILDDLSKTWDTLDGNTQKYLATQAGGLRQGNRFIALMDNYQRSMDIYGEALDSSGTTQEQYNKYLESTQALIDELRVTWEDLYITVLNSDWIKVFYRTLIELVKYLEVAVENIDFVIAAFGGFVIINKIIPTLSLLSKFLVGGEFAKYGKSVSTVVSHLDKLKDGGNAAAGSASTLLTKISSLNPVIMAASAAVGLLAYAFLDAKKKAKEFEEGQRELQKTLEQGSVQDIKNTINNIENLKSKYDSLTAEQESLRKGNEDLSPAWDNTAQKLSKVDDEIQSVIDEMRKYGINTKNIDSELERLNNTLEGKTKALEKEKAEVERLSGIYEDHLDMIKDYDEAQLKSHKELLLQKKAEVEVLKNSITAWAEYTKSRMGAANIPIMPSREDFPAPHDFNQEMKNFRNEMFVFAQDPFSSFGATTANMIDMASQEKIKEVQKNIDGIDAQIDAVNQRLEDWAINHTKVSDDTEDNLTIDDVWEDKVDSIIEQLEREKEHRENIWKQMEKDFDASIEGYENELDLLKEKNKQLEEEEERKKKLKALDEARTELTNILKERRFQRLEGGEFINVADPRKVKEAQDKVREMQDDYNEWEEEKARQKEEKKLQDAIDAEKKKKEAAEERYNDLEDIATDVIDKIKNIDANTYEEREAFLDSYIEYYRKKMAEMSSIAEGYMPEVDYKSPTTDEFEEGDIRYKKIGDDIYKNIGEGWYKVAKDNYSYVPPEIGGSRDAEQTDMERILARYKEAGTTYELSSAGNITKDGRLITDPDSLKYLPSVVGGTREGSKTYQDIMNYNISNLEILANNPEEFAEALRLAAKINT